MWTKQELPFQVELGHLSSRAAPRDTRRVVIFAPLQAALEKGTAAAQATTREARSSSSPRGVARVEPGLDSEGGHLRQRR